MSLITRCPACATMFKVATDQFEAAQGWVRCGHCGEVFEASLHLVPGEAAGLGALASAHYAEPALDQAVTAQETPQPEAGEILLTTLPVELASAHAASELQGLEEPAFTTDAYAFKPASLADAEAAGLVAAAPEAASSAAPEPEAAAPGILEKAAGSRAWLGLLCMLLLAALALQWIVRQKDTLAAQEPRLAPLLQALCRPLGCDIRPLRRIESLVIDSSSFSKTGSDTYRLAFVLKNTGDAALEIPALEVTLTDSRDQALVRRVLLPAQFGATAVTLEARTELAGAVSLKVASDGAQAAAASAQTGPLPVAGYRILAFYP